MAIPNILSVTDSSNESRFENWIQAVQPRALILSGGNDVGEYQVRDTTERHLLSWAEEQKVPVLGICRGMQMMAVWSGGNLIKKEGHVRSRHQLIITGPKNEWPAHVNSYHNWILESCPDGFEVVAQSDDGTIEAIKHKHLPLEGWMWHPERENPFSQPDIKRIQRLFIGQ